MAEVQGQGGQETNTYLEAGFEGQNVGTAQQDAYGGLLRVLNGDCAKGGTGSALLASTAKLLTFLRNSKFTLLLGYFKKVGAQDVTAWAPTSFKYH